MRTRVKICGITSGDALAAAVASGADAVGFVLAESVRRVDPQRAAELARGLPPFIAKVAVFLHPEPDEARRAIDLLRPDWVQADAGDANSFVDWPQNRFLPVFRDGSEEARAVRSEWECALFEAAESGRGVRADWETAARLARRMRLVLAGGLTPENVAAAIARVRPFAVDVSSGVESSPGRKNPARIRAFVEAVREADARLGSEAP